jgi:hypothetical protein
MRRPTIQAAASAALAAAWAKASARAAAWAKASAAAGAAVAADQITADMLGAIEAACDEAERSKS